VLRILNKHLTNERAWLRTESLGAVDKKYAEGARMAKERIPQLEAAISILLNSQQDAKKKVGSKQVAIGKAPPRPQRAQLSLFKIFK